MKRPTPLVLPVLAALALAASSAASSAAGGGAVGAVSGPAAGWATVSLPVPAGQRVTVRDVAACPGGWWLVGGTTDAAGTTAPAAWRSGDGARWTPVPLSPMSTYGRLATLYSVGCEGDRVVAVGAANGGVHGNPRTATWLGDAGGQRLAEVPAPFERYGGGDAIGVERVAAGPLGFLVAGGRVSPRTGLGGAAVWFSPDGAAFTLVDADPALGSDPSTTTAAVDAAPVPGGWLVVGSVLPAGSPGAARDPGAWFSADATGWRREPLPAAPAGVDEALTRAVPWRGGTLAVGVRGDRFGAWLRTGGGWRAGGSFGRFRGVAQPAVTGVAASGGTAYVAAGDGTTYRLWRSADGRSWQELRPPLRMAAGGQRRLLLAERGGRLLLVGDDGVLVRLWLTAGG